MTRYKISIIRGAGMLFLLMGLLLGACSSAADPLPGTSASSNHFEYQLVASPSLEVGKSTSEFTLLAPGSGSARIVDRQGKIVRSAPSEGTIFSLQESPNGEYILLDFGSAKYSVASTRTFSDVATLPKAPPIQDDVTGFRWFLLDDRYLFGASQLRSTDTEGRMASEIDSLLPRATLLYIFDLESEMLTPVEVDDSLPPIFSIHDVAGWNVTLLTYDDELVGARIVRSPAAEDANPP